MEFSFKHNDNNFLINFTIKYLKNIINFKLKKYIIMQNILDNI